MILSEAASLLMSTPGSLIYHLTLVLVLTLLFILARVQRTTESSRPIDRWHLVSAGLLIMRLVLLAIFILAWQGFLEGQQALPALERYVSLAGMALFVWPFFIKEPDRLVNLSLILILGLAFMGLLLNVRDLMGQDTPLPFNPTSADAIWTLTGLGIALVILVALSNLRPSQWGLGLIGFILLTIGYALHIAMGPREGSLAGFVRWAELGAYPLLSIAGVRALAFTHPEDEDLKAELLGKRTQLGGADMLLILGELSELISADQISDFASAVVKGVAELTKAELCMLLTPPDIMERFSIAIGYDLIREQHIPGAALDSKSCPVISTALAQSRTLQLPAGSKSPDLQTLQDKLNFKTLGPTLLVPLVTEAGVQGGIMLLSPYTHRSWNPEDQQALERIAIPIAERIFHLSTTPGRTHAFSDKTPFIAALQQIYVLEDKIADLTAQLQISPDEESGDPSSVLKAHEEALETIQVLEREIKRMKASLSEEANNPSSGDAERREEQFQMLVRELHEVRARLAAAEARRASLEEGVGEGMDIEAAASVANDLRLKMTSIHEYVELLLGESVGTLGPAQRNFVEQIQDGIKELDSLIENLLQITSLEAGPIAAAGPIDLLQCIEEAVTKSSSILREKKIALRMDFPEEMPSINGDAQAIIQIVVHLLNNAIGASPEGEEVVVAARLQAAEEADFLLLTFSDAGEGIPTQDLGLVFQPIDRADSEPIQGLGETSMGLSIVKALSEAMGGRVWFDSEVGEGSIFTVLLPVGESPTK